MAQVGMPLPAPGAGDSRGEIVGPNALPSGKQDAPDDAHQLGQEPVRKLRRISVDGGGLGESDADRHLSSDSMQGGDTGESSD